MNRSHQTALVTGATGFLGGHLVDRLLRDGWDVTALGRNDVVGECLKKKGARFLCVDLTDKEAVINACRGQRFVFHCAARSSPWGRDSGFYRDNVLATRHVVAGCVKEQVTRLVHVSTPSLYFDFRDQLNIAESQPLPRRPANHYVRTKILAEAEVDAAASQIPVVTLRPRALFGAGDTTLFPRIIRANGSKGFPLIGMDDPMIDITCVENVVDALVLSAVSETACGRKFNITNGDPWSRLRLLTTLFKELDLPFRTRSISYPVAYRLAGLLECTSKIFCMSRWEPPLTRYSVGVLAKSQTLDISAAQKSLGYVPKKTISEGLRDFAVWWKESHAAR